MAADHRKRFLGIEAARGIAALLVVLHHAGAIMREQRFYGTEPFGGHFRNFNVGVDFFFVLSGFIITWVHWDDLGRRERLGGYVRKRFLRVYPSYWGIVLPLIAFHLILPHPTNTGVYDAQNILLSVTLLPNPVHPLLGVAWTLTYEIFFYALFGLAIVAGRKALIGLAVWAAAILAAWAFQPLVFPLSFLLDPFNLEFVAGVGAAVALRHRPIPVPGALITVGAASFVALLLFATHIQDDSLAGRCGFGGAALLFVLGVVELERRQRFNLPALLTRMGAASYAVYLIHPLALVAAIVIVKQLVGTTLPIDVIALLVTALAAAAGVAYHMLAEPLLTKGLQRLLDHRGSRSPIVPAESHTEVGS